MSRTGRGGTLTASLITIAGSLGRVPDMPSHALPGSGLTMLLTQQPPSIPVPAEVMTATVELPPGDPGTPPHRHSGPVFGYMLEGEMTFELEGEPERVIRAGEAFWEPGGDVIHYQAANHLKRRAEQVPGRHDRGSRRADADSRLRRGAGGATRPARPATCLSSADRVHRSFPRKRRDGHRFIRATRSSAKQEAHSRRNSCRKPQPKPAAQWWQPFSAPSGLAT